MRILWLCNTLIGEVAEEQGLVLAKPESWIKGFYEETKKDPDINLKYLFPGNTKVEFMKDNVSFQSYMERSYINIDIKQIEFFKEILRQYNPDVIHLFGTEIVHSYAMMIACRDEGCLNKIVVSIQGLVSVYAKHYYGHMPIKEILFPSIRDIYRSNTYFQQKNNFIQRGKYEIEVVKNIENVIGRTDWDEACAKRINPKIKYYFCNELLRKKFYEKRKWSYEECEKHSIFVSQSNYPIKGFHLLLEAMPEIIKKYPDVHLYTTGDNPVKENASERLKQLSYSRYLSKIIQKNKLEKYVSFLGYLDEKSMHDRFIHANIFISSSSIENSPNSLGEAMILGVPVIASDVGGVKNMLLHGEEGFIYPADEPYMIPFYIDKIFGNIDLANLISKKAIAHASSTHDIKQNYTRLKTIYQEINEKQNSRRSE